jgi:hypothetical protein
VHDRSSRGDPAINLPTGKEAGSTKTGCSTAAKRMFSALDGRFLSLPAYSVWFRVYNCRSVHSPRRCSHVGEDAARAQHGH